MGMMRNFLLSAGLVVLPLAVTEERSFLSERGAREREGARLSEDGRLVGDPSRRGVAEADGVRRGAFAPAGREAGRPVDGF